MSFDSTTVFYRNFKLTDKGVKCGVSCSLQIGKGLHCLPSCQMITKSCEASCFRNLYDYSSHKINTNPQHLSPRKSWDFRSEHRISAVFAALFWVLCIGLVYLPEWLRQTGLDTAQIGLVLASATWLKIPVTLIAGNLADRIGRRKKVLLMIAVAAALLFPLLLVVRGYLWLCLLWACIGALISTMVPITDSISVTAVRREGLTYGRMRMWGSLGFLVASVFGGMIIRHFGSDSVVWLLSIGAVVLLVSVAMIPDYETRQPMQKGLLMMLPVFKIPGFVVFLLVAALLMASHAALYSLATVRWVEAGIGLPMVGLLWAIGVVAEIFIFFISARIIARWNPWQLLLIAGVVGVVRWPLMAVVVDVNLLFGIQTMHAITFTFTQLAVVSFIERQVPEELTSSAQTVYDSCALGLIFGGALYISGLLSTVDMAFGFWAMAVMSGVGALVAFSVVRRG